MCPVLLLVLFANGIIFKFDKSSEKDQDEKLSLLYSESESRHVLGVLFDSDLFHSCQGQWVNTIEPWFTYTPDAQESSQSPKPKSKKVFHYWGQIYSKITWLIKNDPLTNPVSIPRNHPCFYPVSIPRKPTDS